MNAAASFANVSFSYPGESKPALAGVDWTIAEGGLTLVAGESGSGKSTLLRCLNGLVPHFSGGRFGGEVVVAGRDTRRHGPRELSRVVGFVFQDPEAQFVTTRVDDEIAFGMEQLGVPPATMRRRVDAMLDLLGIAPLRERAVATLSGGERQRVAVAAALALEPRILALDEPTSQLDPAGAESVLAALTRLNDDLGLTVVLAEHRLERIVAHADWLRALGPAGGAAIDGPPREALARAEPWLLPPLVALGRALGWEPLPLSIEEGRRFVAIDRAAGRAPAPPPADPSPPGGAPSIRLEGARARFGRRDVLHDIDLEARPGELVAVMGRNGSGKTTLLRTIAGFQRPAGGRVDVAGRDIAALHPAEVAADLGYVPQHPSAMLFAETVRQELAFTRKQHGGRGPEPEALLADLGLADLADRHPRDLSGGERERTALAAILAGGPTILLLDEPTRGMDGRRKRELARLLTRLRRDGMTIVLATHDVELVAGMATRVVLLADGRIVADGDPRRVLAGSPAFAPQINKLYGDGFLTPADVLGFDPYAVETIPTGMSIAGL
ncbi:MAG TPA: ATP-binding cassette domain-containing protein [Thermomicrobiales bacterium]|nr:ATP-binding cassette domain-containing protein [Thermomicrobiales bacterium]